MTTSASAIRMPGSEISDAQAERCLHAGLEHYAAGTVDQAAAAYRRGLAVAESGPPGFVSVETVSQLHSNLGNACMRGGDLEQAAASYKAALRLAPDLTSCWCNLGNIELKTGKPDHAVQLYLQALKLNPGHWPSRTNLVQALMATRQYLVAKLLLTELIEERPQDAAIHSELGKLYVELNELESALECFRRAAVLNPGDADPIYWIGGIKQQLGDTAAAEAAYAEAARIQPFVSRPAAKSPADFRVLALFAPFAGNIPSGYLFRDCAYDTDTLALFASCEFDADVLRRDVQVVINLISDADQADGLLSQAADLADRLGKPIVNHPRQIQRTTRDAVAALLQGMPGCIVPKILRQKAGTELALGTLQAALPSSSTVLVRPAGTHGGDDFEKVEGRAALAVTLAQPAGVRPLFHRVCRLPFVRRLFPEIPLHLRQLRNPALSPRDLGRLESASRIRPTWPIIRRCSRKNKLS